MIEVRGDDEVRLAPGVLRSDVETFHEELARRRWHQALAVYQGDFLAAFDVEDAAGFERWADTERGCLRRAAAV